MSLLRCFSSLGCAELSLDETLALAAKHGMAAVELRALGGSVDLPAYFAAQFGSPEELARRLEGSAVRVAALNASLHLIGATANQRDELLALAPWAEAADARWLRVFDGGRTADAAELHSAGETAAWWKAVRAQKGWRVDLVVETHDSLVRTDAIRRFVESVPNVPLLWDAHHTWRKGGEEPAATWAAIGEQVVHVHVKDSVAVPSARHPFSYVLPGNGGFPMRAVRDALERDRFAGCVSLEWERLWHPYLPPLEEALSAATRREWW